MASETNYNISRKRKREDDDDDVIFLEERPKKILKIDPAQCLLCLEEYGRKHGESIFHLEVFIFKRRWYRSVVRHTGIALYHHNTDQWWIHEVNLTGAITKLTTQEELAKKERHITKACDIIASIEKIRSILFDYTWAYRFTTNNCRDHVQFVLERLKMELNIDILPDAEKWIRKIQLRDNIVAFMVGQVALNGLGVSFPVSAAVTGSIILVKEWRKRSMSDIKKVIVNTDSEVKNDEDTCQQNISNGPPSRIRRVLSAFVHNVK